MVEQNKNPAAGSGAQGKAINFIIFDQKEGKNTDYSNLLFICYEFIGFKVSEEAKELLMGLKDDHIGVIAVAGMYRTGKSFLLNRILLE